jgi:ketosteroid isomerase-like protein
LEPPAVCDGRGSVVAGQRLVKHPFQYQVLRAHGAEDVGRATPASEAMSSSYDNGIIAAGSSGDLAYTVGFEHTTAAVDGVPRPYTLRVTTLFRRENGDWKVFHRHGDELQHEQR